MQQRTTEPEATATAKVLDYHERTKHRFDRYAPGPDTLDWEAAPASFRTFSPTTHVSLPLLHELPEQHPARAALDQPYSEPPVAHAVAWSVATVGVLLQCSLGVTAWKSYGPDRWAVRANPSSGNLHPIEAYVLSVGLADLPDGLYHYDAQAHRLALRARPDLAHQVVEHKVGQGERGSEPLEPSPRPAQPALAVALTSVMWREAWKYGERAFRYCQLDTGHAMATLSVAAAALGAELLTCPVLSTDALAALLGVDRVQDFPARRAQYTEAEEPEILLQLYGKTLSAAPIDALLATRALRFVGVASAIDPRPMYSWPVIAEVTQATRIRRLYHAAESGDPQARYRRSPDPRAQLTSPGSCAQVVLGRRSAQRFDIQHHLPAEFFFGILRATLPTARAPFSALQREPAIDLVLFVHRVLGLQPGLYLLQRRGDHSQKLQASLRGNFTPEPVSVPGAPEQLLQLVEAEPKQLMRVARLLHCHQDIAASSCFALGMVAELTQELHENGAHAYRDLHREAGVIGQQLYLAAEARQLRGTGIGCYFDDAFHELLELTDGTFQSLYHFTLGRALDDARVETGPAYPQRQT